MHAKLWVWLTRISRFGSSRWAKGWVAMPPQELLAATAWDPSSICSNVMTVTLDRAQRTLAPWRRRRFARRLTRLRTYLVLRQNMRDASLRAYATIRRFALEIGARGAGDAFDLTAGELTAVLETDLAAVVAERRAAERMYRHFRAPREVGRRSAAPPPPARGQRLDGIGASPGTSSAARASRPPSGLPSPGSSRATCSSARSRTPRGRRS